MLVTVMLHMNRTFMFDNDDAADNDNDDIVEEYPLLIVESILLIAIDR